MSESAIIAICQTVVIVTTTIVGFLTMRAKLIHNATKAEETAKEVKETAKEVKETTKATKEVLEDKIDQNTAITKESADATRAVSSKLNGGIDSAIQQAMEPLSRRLEQLDDHAGRIGALEVGVTEIRNALGPINKNIDSTRHEMRGHLQTIVNSLMLANKLVPAQPPQQEQPTQG